MTRLAAVLTAALILATPARADSRIDGSLRTLRADEALLVLPIHSADKFDALEFYDAASKRVFTIDDVPARLELALIKVPAGAYVLRKIVLPKGSYVEYQSHERRIARFSVRAGVINYAGDMRLSTEHGRVFTSFGGNAIDALPTLLRRERALEQDLFGRFPFAPSPPLDGAALLGRAPPADWTLAEWLSHAPGLDAEAQRALSSDVFKRLGATLPTAGTGFGDARKALGALTKRRAHFDGIETDQRLLVHLDGLWGERGQLMAMELLFIEGKFAQVVVRALEDTGIWAVPAPDSRRDLNEFAAGR